MHPDVEFKRLLVRYKDWKKQFRERLGATQKVGAGPEEGQGAMWVQGTRHGAGRKGAAWRAPAPSRQGLGMTPAQAGTARTHLRHHAPHVTRAQVLKRLAKDEKRAAGLGISVGGGLWRSPTPSLRPLSPLVGGLAAPAWNSSHEGGPLSGPGASSGKHSIFGRFGARRG